MKLFCPLCGGKMKITALVDGMRGPCSHCGVPVEAVVPSDAPQKAHFKPALSPPHEDLTPFEEDPPTNPVLDARQSQIEVVSVDKARLSSSSAQEVQPGSRNSHVDSCPHCGKDFMVRTVFDDPHSRNHQQADQAVAEESGRTPLATNSAQALAKTNALRKGSSSVPIPKDRSSNGNGSNGGASSHEISGQGSDRFRQIRPSTREEGEALGLNGNGDGAHAEDLPTLDEKGGSEAVSEQPGLGQSLLPAEEDPQRLDSPSRRDGRDERGGVGAWLWLVASLLFLLAFVALLYLIFFERELLLQLIGEPEETRTAVPIE